MDRTKHALKHLPRTRRALRNPNHRVQAFIEECEEYCRAAGIKKLATLSTRMMGRGHTLDLIKQGQRGITLKTIREKQAWMRELPPAAYREKHKPGRPRTART